MAWNPFPLEGGSWSTRSLAAAVAGALLLGVTATAAAFSMGIVRTERISLFQAQGEPSALTLRHFNVNVNGPDSLTVRTTLENTDTEEPHAGNVTVTLLAHDGSRLAETTEPTGSVEADRSEKLNFRMEAPSLAERFDHAFVAIEQTG